MINRVTLIGRLTRDPELRTTSNGIAVATFTLAVDRNFTNSRGERDADFINCVVWRKPAEILCNYTSKGSQIGIDGRLQTRTYDDKDGKRVYVTEVVIEDFTFLDTRQDRENRQNNAGGNNSYSNNNGAYNSQPKNSSSTANKPNNSANTKKPADPFSDSKDTVDISDDDLPF